MNILICGVGGQGTLLASRIIGSAVLSEGYDVKISEVHGMSQRGGSVVTYVKFGINVYSPITDKGCADIVLAFEELEALRMLPYLKKGGTVIVNTQRIMPMPVISGKMKYPDNVLDELNSKVKTVAADAYSIAVDAASAKAVNVVMIGILAAYSGIKADAWREAVRTCVPQKFLDMNMKAFEAGYAKGVSADITK